MTEPAVYLDSLPDAVVALLRAVHAALTIPLPDTTDEDERAYARLLQHRSIDARVILAGVLHDGHDVGLAADSLCSWTAERPLTYTPWTNEGGAA